MQYVYPKLKAYCREKHGLEFQVYNKNILPKNILKGWRIVKHNCVESIQSVHHVSKVIKGIV